MKNVKVAVIGAGQRGKDVYGAYALLETRGIECVAVVEPHPVRRTQFQSAHSLKDTACFEHWDDFFAISRPIDAVIIATPDDQHFTPARLALEKGYHVLLEKPMSNNPTECVELGRLAKANGQIFMICHVLRYTPFFQKIKQLIDTGAIGEVVTVQHNENIGYFHMAHSFVRGNWRNTQESSPIILAKSCHDMDILHYLIGDSCTHIQSFGHLSHFKAENAPAESGTRCVSCSVEPDCIYSATRQYLNAIGNWPTTVISPIQTPEAVMAALKEGPYGRCVYRCDNDVCDHQTTNMQFANGVTATFNLSAFSNRVHRTLKIMGTLGEIRADDAKNEISIQRFGDNCTRLYTPKVVGGGHGGGDHEMMADFIELIRNRAGNGLTAAEKSVHSHLMAFAAEASRQSNQTLSLSAYESTLRR